jgi:hypothetical protein
VIGPSRPLPDSLTRLLTAEPEGAFAPTPGDRIRESVPPALPPADRRDALENTVLRGLVITLGIVMWMLILWLVLRHFIPRDVV